MKVLRKWLQNLKTRFKDVRELLSKQMNALTRFELKGALKEEKMDTMTQEMGCKWDEKFLCTTKSWADVCVGDVASNSSIVMHVINQEKNVESTDVRELKESEQQSKNIVIRWIKEDSMD